MAEKKTKSKAVAKSKAQSTELLKLTPANVLQYINPRASKEEVILFLNQCQMFALNPFKREIYLIKYSKDDPAQFVVGYETYLKRADRSQKWNGISFGTEGSGSAMKAWCKVYRKDWEEPLSHEVDFAEYAQTKRGGELNRFWATKPKTMLKKVVIAQALRMAFPDEFAGMPYIVEEIVEPERLPDAMDRFEDSSQIEDYFKKEDVKDEPKEKAKEPEPSPKGQFPEDEKEKEPEDGKPARQSSLKDIIRLQNTLIDKYKFTPEDTLEQMDKVVGSHEVQEFTEEQAEKIKKEFMTKIDLFDLEQMLITKYKFDPKTILDRMDKVVGAHKIIEFTEEQAETARKDFIRIIKHNDDLMAKQKA